MPENKQPNSLSPAPEAPARRRRPLVKTPLFWISIVVILGVGAFFAVRYFTRPKTPTSQASTASSTESASKTVASSSSKTDQTLTTPAAEADESPSVSPDGKTPAGYEGTNPNTSASITGALTAARVSGDQLLIRVNIDQYLSSGTCTLTLSDGAAHSLTRTANLVPVVSTSTCEGFDISASDLAGLSRPLQITIELSSGDKTGIITGGVE